MKLKIILVALVFPLLVDAQQPDTLGVARQVDSLNLASYNLVKNSKYKNALAMSEAAEQLAIKRVGKESAEFARAHFYHSVVLHNMNKYVEAEELLLETKALQEKLIALDHPDYATTLYQLGTTYYYRGNFPEALSHMSAAHQIRESVLGKNHKRYGESLYFLAFLLRKTGNPEKAETLLLEYVAFNERVYGKAHFEYARSLSDLGMLYIKDKVEYKKAERYHQEALAVLEKCVGRLNGTYALTLNYLGTVYLNTSDYEKAEALFLEALAIQKQLQIKPRQITISLDNLADVYLVTGAYDKAEKCVLESLDLYEKIIGIENPNYVNSLSSIAVIFLKKGEYAKSEQFFSKTLERVEQLVGKEHKDYAMSLSNCSMVYLAMKNYAKAEEVLRESQGIYSRLSLQELPDFAATQLTLAKLYFQIGKYDLVEPLLLNAKLILEKTAGKEFHTYANVLNELANVYWIQKRMNLAQPVLEEGIQHQRNALLKATQHLSERELAAYKATYASSLNQVYSFAQEHGAVAASCFDNILFQKGFLLNTVSQVTKLANENPIAAEKYQSLQAFRRRLATEYTLPILERDSARIASLEEKATTLEKEMVRTVAGYAQVTRQVRWQEVQAALQPGEVAVEFVDFQFYNPEATDSVFYAALLLRPGDATPQFIPLFEKKELLPLLSGATGGNNFLKINALYTQKPAKAAQKSLYELIWKPLENALVNSTTVYCSPSGLLHYLNLVAIPTPAGKTFGDTRHLVLLGSTRSLVVPTNILSANTDAYLAGGIRYDTNSTAISYALRELGTRSVELPGGLEFQPDSASARAGALNYLPATATEVREIGQMLRAASFSAKIDTGFYATEESFRSLGIGKPSPRIIHLATHGYFFPDPKGKKAKDPGQEPVFKMSEHPMIRSGLIMAGAKQAWLTGKHPEGQEDGILTAYEISQMNLSNTELVVLSACETGLGQVTGNEGVYGLQRAFKIAGVKYLIMSLWKVDDRSTKAFMAEFYKQWLHGGKNIPQAFQGTQQVMRSKFPSPYDWAGFVLIE